MLRKTAFHIKKKENVTVAHGASGHNIMGLEYAVKQTIGAAGLKF